MTLAVAIFRVNEPYPRAGQLDRREFHSWPFEPLGMFHQPVYDPHLLIASQVGIHRQRENLGRDFLRDRKITGPVPEVCVGFLEMERNWVVDSSADISRS